MSKRQCRNCAHSQPCGIRARFKRAWDETYQHLGPDTGEDSSLVRIMDAVAESCLHFEPSKVRRDVLPINPGGRLG